MTLEWKRCYIIVHSHFALRTPGLRTLASPKTVPLELHQNQNYIYIYTKQKQDFIFPLFSLSHISFTLDADFTRNLFIHEKHFTQIRTKIALSLPLKTVCNHYTKIKVFFAAETSKETYYFTKLSINLLPRYKHSKRSHIDTV